jgi:RNA polymerase sigma-70 factor (ECF subfamily)
MTTTPKTSCLTTAWIMHERELRAWLRHRLRSSADAEDILQDLFLKALRQGDRFCSIQNARAWLFEVARNTIADQLRVARETVELPDDLSETVAPIDTVDNLTACLPRVLSELDDEDRDAIFFCDLQGMSQSEFAKVKGLSLSAAKSRIQRARQRMREHMIVACQVKLDSEGNVEDFTPRM